MHKKNLLTYYNQELAFIRKFAKEFAQAHPKIAGGLKLGARDVEDPHVTRLIEACALLNARIQARLDDDFPEIIDALFNVLYPHYHAPIPSMSIIQFNFKQQELQEPYKIARFAKLQTDKIDGISCNFRTVYPVMLWPLEIAQCKFGLTSVNQPGLQAGDIVSSLQISLSCASDNVNLSELAPNSLRFYLNLPPRYAHLLYDLLFKHTVQIALIDASNQKTIATQNLHQVGFAKDEGLLPYPSQSFLGYRLLTEFFVFPEKFLFFDLKFNDQKIWHAFNKQVELHFYFNRTNNELEQQINKTSLMFGCAPAVNLFEARAEPIRLDHTQFEYQIHPNDLQLQHSIETYSIKRVTGITMDGKNIDYLPFYAAKYHTPDHQSFWYASRKPAWQGEHYQLKGTELFITFVDLNFNPLVQEDCIIDIELLCTNRNLPARLPFSNDKLYMHMLEPSDHIDEVQCLIPPTVSYHPSPSGQKSWQLISHLSLTNLQYGTDTLKNLLKLYDFNTSEVAQNMLHGILAVKTKPITVRRIKTTDYCFWHGTEIIIEVDEDKFSEVGLLLFTSVMDHFFALYTTINSFVQLSIVSKHRGEIYKCQPRAGTQTLL